MLQDCSTFSSEKLRELQLQDPETAELIKMLEDKQYYQDQDGQQPRSLAMRFYLHNFERLRMFDGVVGRLWFEDATGQASQQVILPKPLRQQVLHEYHDLPTSGHFGYDRLLAAIRRRYFWYGMATEISLFCKTCDLCAARKQKRKFKNPMKRYLVGNPFERVAIDIMGPLPPAGENRYILVIQDYFSKWVEALAVPDQKAETVARVLVDRVFSVFGTPFHLHSDQGRDFESKLFKELCAIYRIHKTRTTPRHPESDGMVERMNATLQNILAMFVEDAQNDWHLFLSVVTAAYRATVHKATGFTPNMIVFGRELVLPQDLVTGLAPDEKCEEQSQYIVNLRERQSLAHKLVRLHLESYSRTMKNWYDKGARDQRFAAGDAVWLYEQVPKVKKTQKLRPFWVGPCQVLKVLDPLLYQIKKSFKTKAVVVHVNRLKPYKGDVVPQWFKDPALLGDAVPEPEIVIPPRFTDVGVQVTPPPSRDPSPDRVSINWEPGYPDVGDVILGEVVDDADEPSPVATRTRAKRKLMYNNNKL